MRLAALAALTLSSLCAEPYPDGAALVKPSESALRRLPGYVFDDRSVNNTLMLGKTFTTRNDIHMTKASPGKAHVEVKNEDDHVIAYPTLVLIDLTGKVAAYQIGFDGEESLRSILRR